ncbi:MAG: prenyltransferase, partial [Sciscionella sp.]
MKGPCALSAAEVTRTGHWIASLQQVSGALPHTTDGHLDPWNHVEATMGLDVAGLSERATLAYRWLGEVQNPDGSFHAGYCGGSATDRQCDSNFTAYLAVGVLHHVLSTKDDALLNDLWPAVRGAMGFVLRMRLPTGQLRWRTGAGELALLAGCCSTYLSLRAAERLAHRMGEPHPEWSQARARLGVAIVESPELFVPKTHAMDWYYPVLAGTLDSVAASRRIARRWAEFVVPGHGVRCVSEQPWTTGGETSELAIALAMLGHRRSAAALLRCT